MNARLYAFLTKYNILNDEQFRFQKNKPTCPAALRLTNCAYAALNRRNTLLTALLHFSKAFDTMNHTILITKLETLGVRGSSLRWLKSYLTNRQQYVSLGEV